MTIGTSTPAQTLSPTTQFVGEDILIGNPDGAVGFFGKDPIAQQTVGAVATDLTTVIALANEIRADLIACGLLRAA